MVQLKFKKIHPDAVLPMKEHASDAGMDVRSVEETVLSPLTPTLVKTGLIPVIPEGYEIQVRPRSGLALKEGITVLNSPGTIDSGYRDEIGVILFWVPILDKESDLGTKRLGKGERIAQFVLSEVPECTVSETDVLDETDRSQAGHTGFGSTGRS